MSDKISHGFSCRSMILFSHTEGINSSAAKRLASPSSCLKGITCYFGNINFVYYCPNMPWDEDVSDFVCEREPPAGCRTIFIYDYCGSPSFGLDMQANAINA